MLDRRCRWVFPLADFGLDASVVVLTFYFI